MKQRRQKQAHSPPSWKKLELESRSTSFPAVHTRNLLLKPIISTESHDDRKFATENRSVKSWAKALHSLAQSTISVSSPSKNSADGMNRKMIDLESTPHYPRRTPVLTMTLIKLHDVFETFCNHLTDATYINAQAACLVLDSTTVAASPKNSEPNSPATIIGSPSSQRSSSPSRSPITSWFIGSYNSESVSSEKQEWEKSCKPLIMFAGLEAIYSACSHIESHVQAQTLVRLYERTIDDLRLVREILCDPFIYSTNDESSPVPSIIASYSEKAVTLTHSIEAIMSLCECRCKLIEQQRRLCSSEKLDDEKIMENILELDAIILQNLPKQAAKSTPIMQSVLREVEGWCNLMKTYISLGKCRFMNTIVGCQKVKLKLNLSSDTCIQKWMRKVFQSFVSILPIYFNWVGSDIVSHYGFLESSFRVKPGDNRFGPNLDLEAKLGEFLRFEERSGTPLAIAVVVDHGSSFIGKEKPLNTNQCMVETDDIISAFPAVYIRSTIDQNFSSTVLGTRKNNGRKDGDGDQILEKNPCTGMNLSLEIDSWPYTSWNSLVPLLKGTVPLNSDADSVGIRWSQIDADTSVYISSIHNAMWFVAMKKTGDDNRWNRRNDEERPRKEQEFFTDFSSSLRLRDIFKSILEIRHLEQDSFAIELSDTLKQARLWDEDDTSQLLELFKEVLGLRSPSSKLSYSIPLRKRSTYKSPRLVKRLSMVSSKNPSHYAFFLGSHLMDSIDG